MTNDRLISKIITAMKPIILFDTSDFVTRITMYRQLQANNLLTPNFNKEYDVVKNYIKKTIPQQIAAAKNVKDFKYIGETDSYVNIDFKDIQAKNGYDIVRNDVQLPINPNQVLLQTINWIFTKNIKTKETILTVFTNHDVDEKSVLNPGVNAKDATPTYTNLTYRNDKTATEFHSLLLYIKLLNSITDICDGKNQIIQAMTTLFYIQQNKLNITVNNIADGKVPVEKSIDEFSDDMQHFLKTFNPLYDKEDVRKHTPTYLDLMNYFHDVKHKKPIQPIVFNWIYQNMIINEKNRDENAKKIDLEKNTREQFIARQISQMKIEDSLRRLKTPKDEAEFAPYKQRLLEDNDFKNTFNIVDVYRMPQLTNHNYNNGHTKHITLVHGTSNVSILSILKYGLLDNDSLDQIIEKDSHIHVQYTASGLGRGIYFARLNQVSKSMNYTRGDKIRYIFIADIAYTKIYETRQYDSTNLANDYDLKYGKHVGSYDRDEFVAKSYAQVHPLYMVAVV